MQCTVVVNNKKTSGESPDKSAESRALKDARAVPVGHRKEHGQDDHRDEHGQHAEGQHWLHGFLRPVDGGKFHEFIAKPWERREEDATEDEIGDEASEGCQQNSWKVHGAAV